MAEWPPACRSEQGAAERQQRPGLSSKEKNERFCGNNTSKKGGLIKKN